MSWVTGIFPVVTLRDLISGESEGLGLVCPKLRGCKLTLLMPHSSSVCPYSHL